MYSDDVWGRSGPQAVIDITEPTKAKRIAMVDEIKRALEMADVIPFRYLVQHLGVSGQEFDERRMESAFSSLEEIKVFAGQRGVEVLLENTPNALSTARATELLPERDALEPEVLLRHRSCAYATGVERRIRADEGSDPFHAHPRQRWEGGLSICFPAEGTIDWRKAMRLLRSRVRISIRCLLELKEPADVEHPIEEARRHSRI